MKKITGVLVLVILNIAIVMAQPPVNPGSNPGSNGGAGSVGNASVPLDGGSIGLLLAGAILIGYKTSKDWLKGRKLA